MSMSDRELEEIEKWNRQWISKQISGRVASLIEEVRRSHTEAAEANESLSLIYDHVTRGRISKPNTPAEEVMLLADDLERDFADQEVAERTKEFDTEAAELREKNERLKKELDICQRNLTTCFGAWDELRERVESLEKALEEIRWMVRGRSDLIGVLTQVEAMLGPAIEIVSSERRDKWRAALSPANAQAQPENQKTE